MRIVNQAASFCKGAGTAGKKGNVAAVHVWLTQNVTWGAFKCPDIQTVERLMTNWTALQKSQRAMDLIESAMQRWGRDNLLDFPTKLQVIVQKTEPSSLGYVVEALYAQMWRKNVKDPYGVAELRKVIPQNLWMRTYVKTSMTKYDSLFKVTTVAEDKESAASALSGSMKMVQQFLECPLDFFEKTEGPEKDPTWLQSLPTEALRLFMKHYLDLCQGFYQPETWGALSQVSKLPLEKFVEGTRVMVRFTTPFRVAYDSLIGNPLANANSSDIAGQGDTDKETAGTAGAESAKSGKGDQNEKGISQDKNWRQKRLNCHHFGKSANKNLSFRARGSDGAFGR